MRTATARTIQAHRLSPAETFLLLCKAHGLPEPAMEVRFHSDRLWRFDYAWPEYEVALEQDGGIWNKGRHVRGMGVVRDMEKLNTAAVTGKLGWLVLRYTPAQLQAGEFVETLRAALRMRGGDVDGK